MQVNTLTTDSTDEDIYKCYKDLDSTKNNCKSQGIVILMGDLNAKVDMGQEDIIDGPRGLVAQNEKR